MKQVITLMSDWKLKDPYVAMFKGNLLTAIPEARIIDISHAINLYDITQTAFILKSAFQSFPKGSLHIILTGTTFSTQILPILTAYQGHYFLGADNGLFLLMFNDIKPAQARQYPIEQQTTTYVEKLVKMAKWLFDSQLEENTVPYPKFTFALQKKVIVDKNKIIGQIAYIDSCCNAITNIPNSLFQEIKQNRSFKAQISSTHYLYITKNYDFYNEKEDELYFITNRLGFLEVTMYQSNIAILADIKVGDSVEIDFY